MNPECMKFIAKKLHVGYTKESIATALSAIGHDVLVGLPSRLIKSGYLHWGLFHDLLVGSQRCRSDPRCERPKSLCITHMVPFQTITCV